MKKSYCIICGEEKDGIEVKEDSVLATIRWFKRNVTRNEQGNRLVVCRECYPKYKKMRAKFEGRTKLYLALGITIAAIDIILSPTLEAVLVSIIIIIFFYLFSLLSYIPALNMKKGEERRKTE